VVELRENPLVGPHFLRPRNDGSEASTSAESRTRYFSYASIARVRIRPQTGWLRTLPDALRIHGR
jgi:hypothetical protein